MVQIEHNLVFKISTRNSEFEWWVAGRNIDLWNLGLLRPTDSNEQKQTCRRQTSCLSFLTLTVFAILNYEYNPHVRAACNSVLYQNLWKPPNFEFCTFFTNIKRSQYVFVHDGRTAEHKMLLSEILCVALLHTKKSRKAKT